jgi:hypothetical protein
MISKFPCFLSVLLLSKLPLLPLALLHSATPGMHYFTLREKLNLLVDVHINLRHQIDHLGGMKSLLAHEFAF